MTTILTKHQRLAALRPLSPESDASLAAAWDVRMVADSGRDARATWRGRLAPRRNGRPRSLDPSSSPEN